ncbi:MAG: nitroreductase family protein [Bacteroidales bacterium]|nr:nitroreductase family protein [Bacteroidales bacterium]
MEDMLLMRKSIRKYKSEPIPEQTLDYILQAGIRASNCGNMQLYSVIVTEDKQRKKAYAPLHFNQSMVEDAAVVLTVCADVNRFNKWCEINSADKSLNNFLFLNIATIDATIMAQSMTAAAESKGLGVCWLGTVNYMADKIAEFFNLPQGVVPVACLTVGVPDENPEPTERLPLNAVVHKEVYRDYSPQEIKDMYKDIEQNPVNIQYVKENNLENLAQVFSQVRYAKAGNEEFSARYRQFVEKTFIDGKL